MNRKIITGLGAGLGIILGAVTAAPLPRAQTETVCNSFTPGQIRIELTEPSFTDGCRIWPGSHTKKDPRIRNTGTHPVVAFMEIDVPFAEAVIQAGQQEMISSQPLFSFRIPDTWKYLSEKSQEHEKTLIYGYTKLLKPEDETEPLFEELVTASYPEGNPAQDTSLSVPVRARAVQQEVLGEEPPEEPMTQELLCQLYDTWLAGEGQEGI